MSGRAIRATVALAVFFVSLLGIAPLARAEPPANQSFLTTWQRTDLPVVEGQATRTWMWGPEAFTGEVSEPYAESPGGERVVQYFDKSRMEISDPNADPNSIWYVTNGLLVVELVTGQIQTGNNSFEPRSPASVNVAGDANDPSGPTYATFASILDQPPYAVGGTVIQRLSREGQLTDDAALAEQNITIAIIDDVTNHAIPAPFWDFMTSSGTVYESGDFTIAPLFENAYFATGRPISEPTWADVLVGGSEKLVLMQCFERRCLTYTHDTAPEWQVEAGNVGQHYYAWRYGDGGDNPPPPPAETPECQSVGFPCTLAETPEAAANRTYDLGMDLATMLSDGGSVDDVVQHAQAQPDIVEVLSNATSVRFRVDGAPPAWVFDELIAGKPSTSAIEIQESGAFQELDPARVQPDEVVGKDNDNDGMTDEEPKRALVLAPLHWEFDPYDSSRELVNMLEEVRGYAGQVEYYENTLDEEGEIQEQVTLDMFANWNSYDVVHLLTHGDGVCKEIEGDDSGRLACVSAVLTGIQLTREAATTMNVPGGVMVFQNVSGIEDGTVGILGTLGLTNDFFLVNYPTGLDNTVVHLTACKVFPRDYDPELVVSGDLPEQLAGQSGVVIGWDGTLYVDTGMMYARDTFNMANQSGIPMGEAAQAISLAYGTATYTDPEGNAHPATLTVQTGSDGDLRIREVVTQIHPITLEQVEDGDALPIIGQYGDGVPDRLPFVVEFDGVQDPSEWDVNIRVNGDDLPETFALSGETQVSDLEHRLEADVALWFDAVENQPIELRIWVSLPEGGESKHTVNARLDNPVLDFHSVIETVGGGTVSIRSEVHAEFTLVFNDDFSDIEPGSTTLEYVSYDIDVAGTGCESQATLHDGTIEFTSFDFPTGSDGRISSFVPDEVRIRIPPEISADVTLVCPQGPIELPGTDIHWFAGWVVAHGGVGGPGGGVDEFDETDGVWIIENWQDNPPHKQYDQTIPEGEVTLYETTRMEITLPEA